MEASRLLDGIDEPDLESSAPSSSTVLPTPTMPLDFLKKLFMPSGPRPSAASRAEHAAAVALPEYATNSTDASPTSLQPPSPPKSPSSQVNQKLPNMTPEPTSQATETDLEAQRSHGQQSTESDDDVKDKARGSRVNARIISDAIIGLSDGLTVPFALTAGLSALGDKRVVIFGGLAELIAGAISMGLGGYLGAKSEAESYVATLSETRTLVSSTPVATERLISSVFTPYGIPTTAVDSITTNLRSSPEQLVEFLMLFYHKVPAPETSRPFVCAATIGCAYFLGGFLPLLPYFFVGRHKITTALWWSCIVMTVALFSFGYVKTCIVTGWHGRRNALSGIRGGVQMVFVGGIAAGAAMGLVRGFNSIYH